MSLLLYLLLFCNLVPAKVLLDVGTPDDHSSGAGRIRAEDSWSKPTVFQSNPVRSANLAGGPGGGVAFVFTLDENDHVICIRSFDSCIANVALSIDFDGGESQRIGNSIGTLRYRSRNRWQEDNFLIRAQQIDMARDQDSSLKGKQVLFRLSANVQMSNDLSPVAIDKIWILSGKRNCFFEDGRAVKAVKFDPWVNEHFGSVRKLEGCDEKMDPDGLVRFWKDIGFNTVFLIAQFENNEVCYETKMTPFQSRNFGKDFLRQLADATKREKMRLSAGFWGLRNQPLFDKNPGWRLKDANGHEKPPYLSPNSPYMDDYLIPLIEELHDDYGIDSYFLQEYWVPGGAGGSICDEGIRQFNKLYGYQYDRSGLYKELKKMGELHRQWIDFSMQSMMYLVFAIHRIMDDNGVLVYHNVVGIDHVDWDPEHKARNDINWLWDYPAPGMLGRPFVDYVGNMMLYADLMCFDGMTTWDGLIPSDPIALYPSYRRMNYSLYDVPSDLLICETVGRSIYNRPRD